MGRTSLSFFAQVRLVSFQSLNKLTVRITLGHTLKKSTPVVLLVCMKSYQRSSCLCCSFRKADAKVVLLNIPTKQIGYFFLEFFVNKYNSLNMTTDRHKTKVRPHGSHLYHNAHTRGIVLFCSGSFSGGSLLSGSLSSGSGSLLSSRLA